MHIGRITINTISLDAHLFRCVYGQPGCYDTVGNRIFWNGEQLLAQMLINEAKNHFFQIVVAFLENYVKQIPCFYI